MGGQAESGERGEVVSVVEDESVGSSAAKLMTLVPSPPCSAFFKQVVRDEGLLSRRPTNPHVIEVQLSRVVGPTRLIGRVGQGDVM